MEDEMEKMQMDHPSAGTQLTGSCPRQAHQARRLLLVTTLLLATAACGGPETASATSGTDAGTAMQSGAGAPPDAAPADGATAASPSQDLQLVQFGASMYAAAEFCKLDYDVNTRGTVRAQQKQATLAQGRMSAAQFDAAFDAHSAKVKASFEAMPAAERARNCAQLERIGKPDAG